MEVCPKDRPRRQPLRPLPTACIYIMSTRVIKVCCQAFPVLRKPLEIRTNLRFAFPSLCPLQRKKPATIPGDESHHAEIAPVTSLLFNSNPHPAQTSTSALPCFICISLFRQYSTTMSSASEIYRRPIPGYIPEIWPSVVAAILFAVTSGLFWFSKSGQLP